MWRENENRKTDTNKIKMFFIFVIWSDQITYILCLRCQHYYKNPFEQEKYRIINFKKMVVFRPTHAVIRKPFGIAARMQARRGFQRHQITQQHEDKRLPFAIYQNFIPLITY